MRDADDIATPSVTRLYPRQKQTPAESDVSGLGEVIDFPRSAFDWIFGPHGPYQREIRERATRIRKYAELIERVALTGSTGTLDWLNAIELPAFEKVIKEHEELAAMARGLIWS